MVTKPASFIDDLEVPNSEWWDELPPELDGEDIGVIIYPTALDTTTNPLWASPERETRTESEDKTAASEKYIKQVDTNAIGTPSLSSIAETPDASYARIRPIDVRVASTPYISRESDPPPSRFWTANEIFENQLSSPIYPLHSPRATKLSDDVLSRDGVDRVPESSVCTPDVKSSQTTTQIALSPSPCTDRLKSVIPETPHRNSKYQTDDSTRSFDGVHTDSNTTVETVAVLYAHELEYSQVLADDDDDNFEQIEQVEDSQGTRTSVKDSQTVVKRNISALLESMDRRSKRINRSVY